MFLTIKSKSYTLLITLYVFFESQRRNLFPSMSVCYAELQDLALEATQNDGRLARIPLKNRAREMEAHQFLHSRFCHMIESYNAALEVMSF